LREINLGINDKEYYDFLSVCIDEEITVEAKLQNIIRYHVIMYGNRMKIRNQKLM
jgi:hypothetical protein